MTLCRYPPPSWPEALDEHEAAQSDQIDMWAAHDCTHFGGDALAIEATEHVAVEVQIPRYWTAIAAIAWLIGLGILAVAACYLTYSALIGLRG